MASRFYVLGVLLRNRKIPIRPTNRTRIPPAVCTRLSSNLRYSFDRKDEPVITAATQDLGYAFRGRRNGGISKQATSAPFQWRIPRFVPDDGKISVPYQNSKKTEFSDHGVSIPLRILTSSMLPSCLRRIALLFTLLHHCLYYYISFIMC